MTPAGPAAPKSSAEYPIHVDFVSAETLGTPGRIGMTIAPGKKGPGITGSWHRHLDEDLKRMREVEGASLLVCLLEPHEMTSLAIEDLFVRARAHAMETAHLPIRDGGVRRQN